MTPRHLALDELPRSQKQLAKVAEENGWRWRCDFVEPDSYVMRFRRGACAAEFQVAVAYWSGGKFIAAWRGNPLTRLKAAELKEYLRDVN